MSKLRKQKRGLDHYRVAVAMKKLDVQKNHPESVVTVGIKNGLLAIFKDGEPYKDAKVELTKQPETVT